MQKFHKLVAGTLRYTLLFPLASLGFQGLLHPSMHAQFVSKAHHAETNLKKGVSHRNLHPVYAAGDSHVYTFFNEEMVHVSTVTVPV